MEDSTPLKIADLQSFIDGSFPTFEQVWLDGEKNEQSWISNNYTADEKRRIQAKNREPISIPVAKTRIQRVEGVQKSQRTEFNITASQDPDDEIKAALTKLRVHAVEKRSRFQDVESDVCVSGLAVKYGVSELYLDYSDIYERVKTKKIDYKDFMWDANSKEYDINEDALWCAKIDKQYRKNVQVEYGEVAKEDLDHVNRGTLGNFQGREKISYYIQKNASGNPDYDVISLFNFYIKTPKERYYVLFPDSENIHGITNVIESKHKNRQDAEERLRELQFPYLMQGFPLEGYVEEKTELCIDRYLFCYDKILEYEETNLKKFPFNVYFAVRFENLFCSFMDLLKDTQLWYNKFIMQIDHAMGKANKGAMQINVSDNVLAEGETPTTVMQKLQDGRAILTRTNDKIIQYVDGGGANPQWLGMIDLLTTVLNDLGGGQQFQSKSNASDSGTKANVMIGQGNLFAKPFLDNLRRWKIAVGRNMLDWLELFETSEDVIRVQGGALTPEMIALLSKNGIYAPSQLEKGDGYVTVNKEGTEMSYLKDSNFELEVTEEAMSDNEKNSQLLIALQMEKSDPAFLQSLEWRKYKLTLYGDIPQSIRYKMIQELEGIQQQAEQQKQAAQKMANDKMNIERAKVVAKAPQGTFA